MFRIIKFTISTLSIIFVLGLANQVSAATTNVFYSVSPFGTGTIETGAGNVAISNGVATTTVAQTGNIGVGVCIEYNSLKAYIAPNRIGFDSGSTEIEPGMKITGASSSATGIVRAIEVTGAWDGSAAGWIYFEKHHWNIYR